MKVLLIQEGDSVVVRVPVDGAELDSVPNSKLVDSESLPDREFRDAWTIEGKVDLAKAKEVWKSKIRAIRDKRLEALDIQWMKAMERGDVKIAASIAADKQVLRDVTEREELTKAKTLEQVKDFWPAILEG